MNRDYKEPLFVRYLNGEIGILEMMDSFSRMTEDTYTLKAIENARTAFPDMSGFKEELKGAVLDIMNKGLDEAFKFFVNHYMESSLAEDIKTAKSSLGDNITRTARVKDENETWIQGLICYNMSLYIRAFGLDNLKMCRICQRFFSNKGPYAIYCSDSCKKIGKGTPGKSPKNNSPVL